MAEEAALAPAIYLYLQYADVRRQVCAVRCGTVRSGSVQSGTVQLGIIRRAGPGYRRETGCRCARVPRESVMGDR